MPTKNCPSCGKVFQDVLDLNVGCPTCGAAFPGQALRAALEQECPNCGAFNDRWTLRCPACQGTWEIPRTALESASAPAPAAAEVRPPPRKPSLREYAYVSFAVALLPLAFSVARSEENVGARLQRAIQQHPEIVRRLESEMGKNASPDEVIERFIGYLPGGRLEGALLARNSWMHWGYALVASALFVGMILFIFSAGEARPLDLVRVGLFTGTLGILFLLAVQWIAGVAQGIWFRGGGKLIIVFYIVKFIGFSYRSALDPENGFVLSFLGFTCGVGLCEELCKALPLAWHFTKKATLGWRGACLWGLATGVGFGVSEGITYSSDMYNGLSGGGIYIVRFLSCVALHAIWSAAVGILIFRRRHLIEGEMEGYRRLWGLVRLVAVAMVLHGLYDTLLKSDREALALVVALASFGWLAWLIERMRALEARGELRPARA